jgi:hypothetical protein
LRASGTASLPIFNYGTKRKARADKSVNEQISDDIGEVTGVFAGTGLWATRENRAKKIILGRKHKPGWALQRGFGPQS